MARQWTQGKAFTLAEVLIAKRESGKVSLLNLSRTRELKAPSKKLFKQCAFTLAEVLITLGIIGVVAALTIPIIINMTSESEARSGVRETYSIFSQAMTKMVEENGGDIKGLCNSWDSICLKNIFKSNLKYTKDCDDARNLGCWALNGTSFDGSASGIQNSDSGLVLTNGMSIVFREHYGDCSFTNPDSGNFKCGWIGVDINGLKKPNKWGKDSFIFSIQESGIKPMGSAGDNNNFGQCNTTDAGIWSGCGCAYKYLYK